MEHSRRVSACSRSLRKETLEQCCGPALGATVPGEGTPWRTGLQRLSEGVGAGRYADLETKDGKKEKLGAPKGL